MARFKKLFTVLVITGATSISVTMLVIALCSPWYITNIDQSLPGLFYQIERGELPKRNDVAGIRVPKNPYYPEGAPFLKIIRGVPGDVVTCDGRRFFINGIFAGEAKEQTQRGNPLTLGPTGVIPVMPRCMTWA
ncbi:MAG: S26 family signal peptidase [Gammaproteobacteria bacterium]|nr:S26 family signal peptidase [Gammaproteobacteria bacterium]